ncbi:MAG: tyrosine--tRNA ligase [Myxococcota bacterium]
MSEPSNPYDILLERGFVQQTTDASAIRDAFAEGAVVAYVGLDPTAESLHVGNLVTLMALMHVERCGHRPLVVLGGGTAMVGDPSGRTEMRRMLSRQVIEEHVAAIERQVGSLLDVGKTTTVVDNAEWLLPLDYIGFLRDIGRHFSVNRMLSAEAYKVRLEKGLSFIEFNYQLLQAYDYLELFRRYRCVLQMGGDDQWGNIVAGIDLVRRLEQRTVHGLTFPLLTTATGEKMGKTAQGAVWLSADRFSTFDYYQYWVNTHDDDVVRLLGIFTTLPMNEIREVGSLSGAELNAAKSILAFEATRILHGSDAALASQRAAVGAFGRRPVPSDVLPSSGIPRGAAGDQDAIPTTTVASNEANEGLALVDLMVRGELAASKSAARRLVKQGAVRVDENRIEDERAMIPAAAFDADAITVRVGKKKVHRFRRE